MQPVRYYQIGGFQGHIRENSNDVLAGKLIARDGGAEFVLGIRPNGASYLLLTPEQTFERRLFFRPRSSWGADGFASLSPVHFANKKELVAKLESYKSNGKSRDGKPRDRSKANRQYVSAPDAVLPAGRQLHVRASFEHQRVLYGIWQETIQKSVYQQYALRLAPWLRDVTICSFAFNLWAADHRSLEERRAKPHVLDVGWTEFDRPTDSTDLNANSTSHLSIDRHMGQGKGKKRGVIPTVTVAESPESAKKLLQTLFAPEKDGRARPTKLLFVYDATMTRCVLQSFGVDTSKWDWDLSIKDLLYCASNPEDRGSDGHSTRPEDRHPPSWRDRHYSRGWTRERSRSPRRSRPADECRRRPQSPPPPPAVASRDATHPVYVVDVQQLYRALMVPPPDRDGLLSAARALNVRNTAIARDEEGELVYEDVDVDEWCAGKESRLLGYVWEEMARCEAIDEQRCRREGEPICANQLGGFEEDADPNDSMQPAVQGPDSLEYDDDDYW